jgi:Skp family chaperone for outer membrane proteins
MYDLVGSKYGMLIVENKAFSRDATYWNCVCICGAKVIRSTGQLNRSIKRVVSMSCGCITSKTKNQIGGIRCGKCLEIKDESCFSKQGKSFQSSCKDCCKKWREENKEYLKKSKSEYHYKNRESINKKQSERQKLNKDASNARSAKWRENNPDKRKDVANSWVKRNKSYMCQRTRLRFAKAMNAVPFWADKKKTQEIYDKARNMRMTGVDVVVDHVVPLVSDFVCGLHWHGNLEIINRIENIRKSNKYWPDMP